MTHVGKTFYLVEEGKSLSMLKTTIIRETAKLVFFDGFNPCAAYTMQAEKWKFEEIESKLHTQPMAALEAYIGQIEEKIARLSGFQAEAQTALLKLQSKAQPNSEKLAEQCLRLGATPAEVGAWSDERRQEYIAEQEQGR